MPSLPVDSAMSCSTHRPKLEIGSDTAKVSLSRPRCASSPITHPSQSPEFGSGESYCWQFCSATCAWRSMPSTFTPASTAGTRPK